MFINVRTKRLLTSASVNIINHSFCSCQYSNSPPSPVMIWNEIVFIMVFIFINPFLAESRLTSSENSVDQDQIFSASIFITGKSLIRFPYLSMKFPTHESGHSISRNGWCPIFYFTCRSCDSLFCHMILAKWILAISIMCYRDEITRCWDDERNAIYFFPENRVTSFH